MDWLEYLNWDKNQINDIRYIAYSYLTEGKYDIALGFFEALTVLDPDNAYDLQALGAIYLQTNKNKDALNCLNMALKLQPNHQPSLMNKALALISLGKKKESGNILKILQNTEDKKIANKATALLASLT